MTNQVFQEITQTQAPADMVWIPGGTFLMGPDSFYPEGGPVHEVAVDGFWMHRHVVTNELFARFVEATGYVTVAERELTPEDYPGAPAETLVPGALVFRRSRGPVDLIDYTNWWTWIPGTSWRRPTGPHSSIGEILQHPVVHVAYEDAEAYAHWAGRDLPTGAEWERAARGGLDGKKFTWCDEYFLGGNAMANSWQGEFPCKTCSSTASKGPLPSALSQPTATDYSIWPEMFGNGRRIGMCISLRTKSCPHAAGPLLIRGFSLLRRATIRGSRRSASHANSQL